MRISTLTIYNQNTTAMNRQQADFMKVGQQIASGKRVVNISDDPQAMAQALNVGQSKAVTQQYTDARIGVRNALGQEESVLNSVSDIYSRAKTLMVQASNGTLSDGDRDAVASEMRGLYESLVGLGNSRDGNGLYLFGGYEDGSAPFIRNPDETVEFVGSTDVREQRIDGDRTMPIGHSADDVFRSVRGGTNYLASASATNQGSVTYSSVNVIDSTDPNYGDTFTIDFGGTAAAPTYSINGGAAVAYTDPTDIQVGGLQIELTGAPEPGDQVTMSPAAAGNTDVFRTFEKAIAALEAPSNTPQSGAALRNTLNTVMNEFDNSMDNVLTVRAEVGARLNELDTLETIASNRMLAYEQTLSSLVDLDYVEAASEYSMRMVGLQAAQKAFVDMKDLSLFNMLR